MMPKEFWNSDIADCILFINGYEERLTDGWKQTREIVYMIYCSATEAKGRENIFDFMPLPGDPTKEEIKQLKIGATKKRMEGVNERLKKLVEKGIIKKVGSRESGVGKKK